MEKYVCKICGYVYDPEIRDTEDGDVPAVAPGTAFVDISDDCECCFDCYSSNNSDVLSYGFFLPKDAVKENKSYRACRNAKELYELVFACKSKVEHSFCINELVVTVIHFKQ